MIAKEISEKIDKMGEVEIYLFIEECGGYLWHTQHELSHGRMENSQKTQERLKKVSEIQQYCVSMLSKFGIDPESAKDIPDGAYWKWYKFWNQWHKEELTDEQRNDISTKMEVGEDFSKYYLKKIRYIKLMKLDNKPLW